MIQHFDKIMSQDLLQMMKMDGLVRMKRMMFEKGLLLALSFLMLSLNLTVFLLILSLKNKKCIENTSKLECI